MYPQKLSEAELVKQINLLICLNSKKIKRDFPQFQQHRYRITTMLIFLHGRYRYER